MIVEELSDAIRKIAGMPEDNSKDEILKYFKPTITQGFWGTKIVWEEREGVTYKDYLSLRIKNK